MALVAQRLKIIALVSAAFRFTLNVINVCRGNPLATQSVLSAPRLTGKHFSTEFLPVGPVTSFRGGIKSHSVLPWLPRFPPHWSMLSRQRRHWMTLRYVGMRSTLVGLNALPVHKHYHGRNGSGNRKCFTVPQARIAELPRKHSLEGVVQYRRSGLEPSSHCAGSPELSVHRHPLGSTRHAENPATLGRASCRAVCMADTTMHRTSEVSFSSPPLTRDCHSGRLSQRKSSSPTFTRLKNHSWVKFGCENSERFCGF